MLVYWKTKKFKDLQGEWYEKLKSFGFKDLEYQSNDTIIGFKSDESDVQREAKREYYSALAQYIKEYAPEFDDSIDYFVMYKFSIGYKNVQIRKELSAMGISRHKKTIMYIRRKYESRWGLREWKPEQLRSRRMPRRRR